MENIINKYFEDKKISAYVKETLKSDSFVTYVIGLHNIMDLKKFNGAMQKELSFILSHDVTLNIDREITIMYNESNVVNKALKGIVIDVGKDTKGDKILIDFKNNPHWLIGGSTGSGKSVFLNNIIYQLIEQYNNCIEFGFVDLKQVELYKYNGLDMNVEDVANDLEHAIDLLKYAVDIMNERYNKYKKSGVLDIDSYNSISESKDKYFFVVIDELAELMLQDKKAIQPLLQRLLQLGRASGVYCICATQRPSADVINGILKVNFTTRICFKVSNMYDSRTIINQKGAELLCGNGDGYILKNGDFGLIRFQGYPPIEDDEKLLHDNKQKRYYNIPRINFNIGGVKGFGTCISFMIKILISVITIIIQLCASCIMLMFNIGIWLMVLIMAIFKRR